MQFQWATTPKAVDILEGPAVYSRCVWPLPGYAGVNYVECASSSLVKHKYKRTCLIIVGEE